jgi:hypothetical protein
VKSPGVGDYNLTGFKSYAKASETAFEMTVKYTTIQNSGEKRFGRAKSALYRQGDSKM